MNKFDLIEIGRFFISIRAQYYRKKDSLFVYSLFSVIVDFHNTENFLWNFDRNLSTCRHEDHEIKIFQK